MKLFELQAVKSADEIVKLLTNECADFIAAYKQSNKALLRGVGASQGSSNPLVMGTVRADRRPSATPQANFELMNNALASLELPTKANTISCSTIRKEAGAWGPVHVLFMKDGWRGLTFEHADFDDLYVRSDPIVRAGGEDQVKAMAEVIKKFRPILISSSSDLAEALNEKHNEILMQGTQYYALRANSPVTAEVLQALDLNLSNL